MVAICAAVTVAQAVAEAVSVDEETFMVVEVLEDQGGMADLDLVDLDRGPRVDLGQEGLVCVEAGVGTEVDSMEISTLLLDLEALEVPADQEISKGDLGIKVGVAKGIIQVLIKALRMAIPMGRNACGKINSNNLAVMKYV